MDKKIIIIESLEQFEQQIALLPKENIIFRGENAFYDSMDSSAFRRPLESTEGETAYNWHELIKEFYSEVEAKLTNQERKSFIAFSQHYGIPTNLLDVTTSPFVALYFACQPNDRLNLRQRISEANYNRLLDQYNPEDINNYFSDAGSIFYFDKFIDATLLIEQLSDKNFIDHFFLDKDEHRISLLPYLQKYKKNYPNEFHELWHEFKRIAHYTIAEHSNYGPLDRKLSKLFDYEKLQENYHAIFDFLKDRKQFKLLRQQVKNFDIDVVAYIMAISLYIKREKDVYGDNEESIPYLPNLLYAPPIEFERGKNQNGKFLHQAYFNYNDTLLDFIPEMHGKKYWNSFSLQIFNPSNTVFKIINKEQLLESLDKKGINQKTIWCDFDNIANYIKKQAKGTTTIGI